MVNQRVSSLSKIMNGTLVSFNGDFGIIRSESSCNTKGFYASLAEFMQANIIPEVGESLQFRKYVASDGTFKATDLKLINFKESSQMSDKIPNAELINFDSDSDFGLVTLIGSVGELGSSNSIYVHGSVLRDAGIKEPDSDDYSHIKIWAKVGLDSETNETIIFEIEFI